MDPEVPELGSGAQPADRLVRGAADRISIRKRWNSSHDLYFRSSKTLLNRHL